MTAKFKMASTVQCKDKDGKVVYHGSVFRLMSEFMALKPEPSDLTQQMLEFADDSTEVLELDYNDLPENSVVDMVVDLVTELPGVTRCLALGLMQAAIADISEQMHTSKYNHPEY